AKMRGRERSTRFEHGKATRWLHLDEDPVGRQSEANAFEVWVELAQLGHARAVAALRGGGGCCRVDEPRTSLQQLLLDTLELASGKVQSLLHGLSIGWCD